MNGTIPIQSMFGAQAYAQEVFQLTADDCAFATREINKGHGVEVWQVVNACFADQQARDAVKTNGFAAELKARLETKQAHLDKVAEVSAYIKGGYVRIEVNGELVPIDLITVDDSIVAEPSPK